MLTLLSLILISIAGALWFQKTIEGACTVLLSSKRRTYETQKLITTPIKTTKRRTKKKSA